MRKRNLGPCESCGAVGRCLCGSSAVEPAKVFCYGCRKEYALSHVKKRFTRASPRRWRERQVVHSRRRVEA